MDKLLLFSICCHQGVANVAKSDVAVVPGAASGSHGGSAHLPRQGQFDFRCLHESQLPSVDEQTERYAAETGIAGSVVGLVRFTTGEPHHTKPLLRVAELREWC